MLDFFNTDSIKKNQELPRRYKIDFFLPVKQSVARHPQIKSTNVIVRLCLSSIFYQIIKKLWRLEVNFCTKRKFNDTRHVFRAIEAFRLAKTRSLHTKTTELFNLYKQELQTNVADFTRKENAEELNVEHFSFSAF